MDKMVKRTTMNCQLNLYKISIEDASFYHDIYTDFIVISESEKVARTVIDERVKDKFKDKICIEKIADVTNVPSDKINSIIAYSYYE